MISQFWREDSWPVAGSYDGSSFLYQFFFYSLFVWWNSECDTINVHHIYSHQFVIVIMICKNIHVHYHEVDQAIEPLNLPANFLIIMNTRFVLTRAVYLFFSDLFRYVIDFSLEIVFIIQFWL